MYIGTGIYLLLLFIYVSNSTGEKFTEIMYSDKHMKISGGSTSSSTVGDSSGSSSPTSKKTGCDELVSEDNLTKKAEIWLEKYSSSFE